MSERGETGPERLRRVQHLFHEALKVEEGNRSDSLHRAANGDLRIIEEVQRLLTHHDPGDSFLDPLCPNVESTHALNPVAVGCMVGAYRLTRKIESGGMGTVWAGERADGLFEQRVAVKLLSWGLVSAA